jgi:glycosyltransferase involved in cell wall biosynthesis
MSAKPIISVVIPCYDQGEWLPEAVASVTDLRRDDVELIVVDDGSSDGRTLREMDRLARRGIQVVRQPNKGLGGARNAGVRAARGEFILPLDSDNRIREPYVTAGVRLLQDRSEVGVVYGDAEFFGDRKGPWRVREFDLAELCRDNFIDACALYRKAVWESVGGYDENMPWMGWEDWEFWIRTAMRGWEFVHLDAVAFEYRVRTGSMLSGIKAHEDELLDYIFTKPENRAAAALRALVLELVPLREKVRAVETSRDYRLGRAVLDPIRRLLGIPIRRE